MENLAYLSVKTGLGAMDYILCEGVRDFCNMWVISGGIVLIMVLLLIKKALAEE